MECVKSGCPGVSCVNRDCWMREGFRLAIELIRNDLDCVPRRPCELAAEMIPGWDAAGPDYQPIGEPTSEQLALMQQYGLTE